MASLRLIYCQLPICIISFSALRYTIAYYETLLQMGE